LELIKGDETGDFLRNLAFTKSGSRIVCLALAYGNAKDRKQILKCYKDTFRTIIADPNGHRVFLAVYELLDDTVLVSKAIFSELFSKDTTRCIEDIVFFVNDLNARIPILYLFKGHSKALFPPSHSSDLDLLAEIGTIRTTTSKKDPELRRLELIKAISPYLLEVIAASPGVFTPTSFGCQFVTDVMFGAVGDRFDCLNKIAALAGGTPRFAEAEAGGPDRQPIVPHIAKTAFGGKMLKALVAGGRFDNKKNKIVLVEPPLNFADILYPHIKEHIVLWAIGSSSFVILALLESSDFSSREEILHALRDRRDMLHKVATRETSEQKVTGEAVEKEQNVKVGCKKKSSLQREPEGGNRGTALLLKML